jgi:hypothetical protein
VLLVVGVMAGIGPLVAFAAPASAYTPPPGAAGPASCPWYLGPISTSGAAGSEGVIASFIPAFTTENCVTTTAVTLGFQTPSGVRSTNISGNPITATATIRFSPGGDASTFTFFWSPHCGDPQPVRMIVSSAGQSTYVDNAGSSCSEFGTNVTSRLSVVGSNVDTAEIATGIATTQDHGGAWVAFNNVSDVRTHGDAPQLGTITLKTHPIRGIAADPTGVGYWQVATDGGVFTSGAARFFGSTGNLRLNQPVVGIASTPDGKGYWLVASDGGIFSFGDAAFFGSTGNLRLNQPVVGMAPTPDGKGYWLVASDGGIFTFGDAKFFGSTGNLRLNQPVVGIASTPDGMGYWLVASDGGIFTFGDATFHGSGGGHPLASRASGLARTASGGGYWMLLSDGSILNFGDAAAF